MKKHLFGSTILPLALVVSLCACGSTPGGSAPSEGTQSAASQAQTDSAMSGGELSIGNDFYIESGAVLSDGSIYLVGKEGANGFCAYVSTDDGDSWSKEELSWADQDVVAITILPDGFMLGTQGQQVVYAPRGEDLKTADLSALGTVDGISAAYPISTDAFTVSGGKTETFVDKDGQEQETVHPLPFEDMVLRYDGSLVAQWGNGISTQEAGCYTSDGTKLYYLDYASNELCSLNAEGQIETYGALGNISGDSFCKGGIFYYVDDQGVAAYDTATNANTRVLTDSLAPYLQANAQCTLLLISDHHIFAVTSDMNSDAQAVYRYEI